MSEARGSVPWHGEDARPWVEGLHVTGVLPAVGSSCKWVSQQQAFDWGVFTQSLPFKQLEMELAHSVKPLTKRLWTYVETEHLFF